MLVLDYEKTKKKYIKNIDIDDNNYLLSLSKNNSTDPNK